MCYDVYGLYSTSKLGQLDENGPGSTCKQTKDIDRRVPYESRSKSMGETRVVHFWVQ